MDAVIVGAVLAELGATLRPETVGAEVCFLIVEAANPLLQFPAAGRARIAALFNVNHMMDDYCRILFSLRNETPSNTKLRQEPLAK